MRRKGKISVKVFSPNYLKMIIGIGVRNLLISKNHTQAIFISDVRRRRLLNDRHHKWFDFVSKTNYREHQCNSENKKEFQSKCLISSGVSIVDWLVAEISKSRNFGVWIPRLQIVEPSKYAWHTSRYFLVRIFWNTWRRSNQTINDMSKGRFWNRHHQNLFVFWHLTKYFEARTVLANWIFGV